MTLRSIPLPSPIIDSTLAVKIVVRWRTEGHVWLFLVQKHCAGKYEDNQGWNESPEEGAVRPSWLLGSSVIILKPIHATAWIKNSFFSIADGILLFIHSPVGGVKEVKKSGQEKDPSIPIEK